MRIDETATIALLVCVDEKLEIFWTLPALGQRLRELYEDAGFTQREFAKRVRMTPPSVVRLVQGGQNLTWETGQRAFAGVRFKVGWVIVPVTSEVDEALPDAEPPVTPP